MVALRKILKWSTISLVSVLVIGMIMMALFRGLNIESKSGEELLMFVMMITCVATIINVLSTLSVFFVDYMVYCGVMNLGKLMKESTNEIRKQFGDLNNQVMNFLTMIIQAQNVISQPANEKKKSSFNLKMGFADEDKDSVDDEKYVKVIKVKFE